MHKGSEKYEKTQLELNLYNASHCHHTGKVLVECVKVARGKQFEYNRHKLTLKNLDTKPYHHIGLCPSSLP